jgi:hypothetical protein
MFFCVRIQAFVLFVVEGGGGGFLGTKFNSTGVCVCVCVSCICLFPVPWGNISPRELLGTPAVAHLQPKTTKKTTESGSTAPHRYFVCVCISTWNAKRTQLTCAHTQKRHFPVQIRHPNAAGSSEQDLREHHQKPLLWWFQFFYKCFYKVPLYCALLLVPFLFPRQIFKKMVFYRCPLRERRWRREHVVDVDLVLPGKQNNF